MDLPVRGFQPGGLAGEVQFEFGIAETGELQFIKKRRSSSVEMLDEYAMTAVKLASPFPSMPYALSTGGLPITGTFHHRLLGSGLIINYLDLQALPEDVVTSERKQLALATAKKNVDDTRRALDDADRQLTEAKRQPPVTTWVGVTVLRYQCWPERWIHFKIAFRILRSH